VLATWQAMGEHAPHAFLVATVDGQILYANQRYRQLAALPSRDVQGTPHQWLQWLAPADQARLTAKLAQTAGLLDEEVSYVAAQHELRWLHLRCWPAAPLEPTAPVSWIVTFEEITQRKNAELALRTSNTIQHEFSDRLARLSRIVLRLTHAASLDELCRDAVESGIRELGFDRLGLWLISEVPGMIRGTYGTDEAGQLRDERAYHTPIVENDLLLHFIQQPEQRYAYFLGKQIRDVNLNQVGEGWHVVTGLWDGETIIGYLFADNLLRQLPYREQDGELLSLYASTLGHLCTHLRIEEKWHSRHRAANVFLSKMAALSKVAAALTLSTNVEELCRNAIILGRAELGFDRLGLWFTDDEVTELTGTYGTDENGNLRNEWGMIMRIKDDFPMQQALKHKERYACDTNIMIPALSGEKLTFGWKATAGLWNGEKIIGYLFSDNLLNHQPYSEHDGELLALYALLLGHLCTRQRIEEALREREVSYRTLLNAIPDYMLVVTRQGLVLDCHAAHQPLPNLDLSCFVGKLMVDLLPAEIADLFRLAIEDAFTKHRIASFESIASIHGEQRHFEARVTAGDHNKVVALVRDVTDRKRLEEQLYASQKLESLGRMASGIAHDFNNMLTVIQGFTSMAESQLPENATRLQKAFTHIRSATEKGARLTNQLLLFARKQPSQPKVLNLNDLIRGIKPILHTTLGEALNLFLQLEPQLGPVELDPGQFEQVLINLAVNARDAMPVGGTLTITTQNLWLGEQDQWRQLTLAAGAYVLIELSDTGNGIEPDLMSKIFEPFFTTKAPGKGTGLGLSICQSIIQQAGGHIRLQSTLGAGSTFQIVLPQTVKPLTAVATPTDLQDTTGAETILLVEDDVPVRAVAVEVLSSQGYRVLECANGAVALDIASDQATTIDLMITDMIMPQMNGVEVAERFMQIRPQTPILLVSGYVAELPETLIQQPTVTFLAKPYTLYSLTSTVRTILDQQPS